MLKLPIQIFLASIAAATLMSALPMMVLIAGLVGTKLAPSATLATLPITAMVIGIALNSIPTAYIIRRVGRKNSFLLGVFIAMLANALAATALIKESFTLWMIAAFLIGTYCSIATQMRFIVVEYVKPQQIPTALSVMMLGGILAAFLGPELGSSASLFFQTPYLGSFVGISLLQVIGAGLMFSLKKQECHLNDNQLKTDSLSEPPAWKWLAIASSVWAYGLMSYVMTATPISMHVHHGFELSVSKNVIQWHIIAMFLPALFMGKLIEHFGEMNILLAGVICYLLTFAFTLSGITLPHFSLGLIFLGVGWNMMFTVGSTMIAKYDRTHKLQGIHDMFTFSIQGFTTFAAGIVISRFGWQSVQISAIIALAPYMIYLLLYKVRFSK